MFNVSNVIESGGILLVALIIFAESGMLIGFFFPGDTLLFSAGILAAGGRLPIVEVILVIAAAAILGDNVGYHIGKHLGRRLFSRADGFIFRKSHIERAERFFQKYGSRTMLIAHFFPVVRTFVPVTAGAGKMPLRTYFIYDAIGDTTWAASITLLGYFVGSRIPGIENLIDPILIGIVLVSLVPTIYHLARDPKVRDWLRRKSH